MLDNLFLMLNEPLAFIPVALLFGLAIGSFLNVVIHRMPVMMQREWKHQCMELLEQPDGSETSDRYDLVWPPSTCPKCHTRIKAIHNIPVFSYLILRGKCAGCGGAISARYPIIEAFTGVLSAVVAWHFGFGWECLAALVFTWLLIAMSGIDIDHQLLPDSLTLLLLWLGLAVNIHGMFVPLEDAVIGALAGYLSLRGVYHLFKLLTGKEGMGFGDFKLFAAFGAWLGWQALPLIILLSSLVGAVIGIALIGLRGRDRNIPIPFGPYLAAAGWIALLWGEQITGWYLGQFS